MALLWEPLDQVFVKLSEAVAEVGALGITGLCGFLDLTTKSDSLLAGEQKAAETLWLECRQFG